MGGKDKFRRGLKVSRINGGGVDYGAKSQIWLPPGVEAPQPPKPKRNEPCPCGSEKKYKQCCGASPSQERPPCSVKDCEEPVHFFLSPSVEGQRSDTHFWVACKGHVQDIAASASAVGMDVDVIPFDSIEGMTTAPEGVDVVREPVLPEAAPEPEQDSVE